MAWDATVIDTLAESYRARSAEAAGDAAEITAERKSIPQFNLHRPTALCPWPSKLLASSITKAWLSLITLATASHKIAGDSKEAACILLLSNSKYRTRTCCRVVQRQ